MQKTCWQLSVGTQFIEKAVETLIEQYLERWNVELPQKQSP